MEVLTQQDQDEVGLLFNGLWGMAMVSVLRLHFKQLDPETQVWTGDWPFMLGTRNSQWLILHNSLRDKWRFGILVALIRDFPLTVGMGNLRRLN